MLNPSITSMQSIFLNIRVLSDGIKKSGLADYFAEFQSFIFFPNNDYISSENFSACAFRHLIKHNKKILHEIRELQCYLSIPPKSATVKTYTLILIDKIKLLDELLINQDEAFDWSLVEANAQLQLFKSSSSYNIKSCEDAIKLLTIFKSRLVALRSDFINFMHDTKSNIDNLLKLGGEAQTTSRLLVKYSSCLQEIKRQESKSQLVPVDLSPEFAESTTRIPSPT